MDRDRIERLKDLIDHAVDLPVEHRDPYLERTCGDDAGLLAEARDLLRRHGTDDPLDLAVAPPAPDLTGRTVGPYRILESIGEGGMGVVYRAMQTEPLQREVALKVIKMGMDTREVVARFATERQALARMDHPNIAKVLDAGATDEGRPFFVMEFIRGEPLLQFCAERNLDLRERLDLFLQVCRGVQHAHHKGVIHRDLKPGNILVSEVEGRGVPRIIDFGVAKAMETHQALRTAMTRQGLMLGTPEYMSPEQAGASGEDVDTRSDIYSLGVVLYELLTGMRPLERSELMRAGYEGVGRAIRDRTPAKPSTRLLASGADGPSGAAAGGPATHSWGKRLRGDLDWITMKALEKEPDRRYEAPLELANDIVRFLSNEPVVAGPPSRSYRIGKFVKRNRTAVVAGVVVCLALVSGILGTSLGLVRALAAERRALAAADRATAANLCQAARDLTDPADGLAYITAALERDDREEYRDFARRLLLRTPPVHRFPKAEGAHNPIVMKFSPDGRWLAVGWSMRGLVQVYEHGRDEPIELEGHSGSVFQIAFTRDSRTLVTAANDSTLRFWSVAEGENLRTVRLDGPAYLWLDEASARVVTATAVADRPWLWQAWPMAGGGPAELGCCGPAIGNALNRQRPGLDVERGLAAVPAGDHVDVYGLDRIADGPQLTVARHDANIGGAVFVPDGRLVTWEGSGLLRLWDVNDGRGGPLREFHGGEMPTGVGFSPDGKEMAVSAAYGVHAWDLTQSDAVGPRVFPSDQWHFEPAYHPEGTWLVAAASGRRINAWPLHGRYPLTLTLASGNGAAMDFSPDGRWLATASYGGTIEVWPLEGGRVGRPRTVFHADNHLFMFVRFDAESRTVFASTCNSPEGNGLLVQVSVDGQELQRWHEWTCGFDIAPDGRRIAAHADPTMGQPFVQVLDLETGERLKLGAPHGGMERLIGFVADGRLVGSGPGGTRVRSLDGGPERLLAAEPLSGFILPGRRHVLLRDAEGAVLYDAQDEFRPQRLPVWFRRSSPGILAADSSATLLVAASATGMQCLDLRRDERQTLPLFEENSLQAAIDSRGRWLAASGDGLVKLVPLPLDPFWGDPSREDLLQWLRQATNLRTVPAQDAEWGVRLVSEGVPRWNDGSR